MLMIMRRDTIIISELLGDGSVNIVKSEHHSSYKIFINSIV